MVQGQSEEQDNESAPRKRDSTGGLSTNQDRSVCECVLIVMSDEQKRI